MENMMLEHIKDAIKYFRRINTIYEVNETEESPWENEKMLGQKKL